MPKNSQKVQRKKEENRNSLYKMNLVLLIMYNVIIMMVNLIMFKNLIAIL